ncbi:MAG: glycosyltransferase family 4 protein [Sphingobacteriaceae bacterium]|nr:glycosyltransferase family 4 protein [Sphingobacteriaceae bacterium]
MEPRKLLLLWAPLADYSVACMKALAKKNVELYIVFQGGESDAPYDQFDLSFCKKAIAYSKDKESELFDYCMKLAPDVIMMSSWNYRFYMSVSRECKKRGTYVVSTFDGQWTGTLKQRLGILSSSVFLKPAIDNFFVPGDRQANFARKLGYNNPFLGYYSANTERFKDVTINQGERKFIFVGRLVPVKGIQYLMSAYKKYRASVDNPWGLIICGKGALKHLCENQEGVEIHGFTQPSQLPERLASAKCFILPSLFEPWGLVVHEAALAGLPIISSYASGASTFYVRDGQNGYVVNPDEESLLRAMKLVSAASDEKLEQMSQISKALGSLWTTEKWADYVFQYICNRNIYSQPEKLELASA